MNYERYKRKCKLVILFGEENNFKLAYLYKLFFKCFDQEGQGIDVIKTKENALYKYTFKAEGENIFYIEVTLEGIINRIYPCFYLFSIDNSSYGEALIKAYLKLMLKEYYGIMVGGNYIVKNE